MPASSDRMVVQFAGRLVGHIRDIDGRIGFTYDEGWLADIASRARGLLRRLGE